MALKLFNKANEQDAHPVDSVDANQRMEQMENHLRDLGLEVLKLRQEVNTILARQQTFKIALGRLREYLEDRGALDETAQDLKVPFQDLLHENMAERDVPLSLGPGRKNKSNLH